MSAWTPTYRITVNGTAYTSTTLSGLTIQSGRNNVYEQPYAGYVKFDLLNTTNTVSPIAVNDTVAIAVQDNSAAYVTIFNGVVSDVGVALRSLGTSFTQATQVTALGKLARLPKAIFLQDLAQGTDGAQLTSVLQDALLNNWGEVNQTVTWATYNGATTWATAENVGLGTIDSGVYTLAARTAASTDAYSLASLLALSGLGYLYENSSGNVCWANATHRSTYLAANGYKNLSASNAYGDGLKVITRAGDVRNDITMKYGAGSTLSYENFTASSVAAYGTLAQIITTTLLNLSDATSQVAFYLSIRSTPNNNLETITFDLTNSNITTTERDAMLNVFMGMPVTITGLTTAMGTEFAGFVEGWQFQATLTQLLLTLTISPLAYSLQSMAWADVAITESWATLSPIMDYAHAQLVY